MFFQVRCAGCGHPGASPCTGCAARLTPAPVLACPEGLDELFALLAYDERSRPFVTAAKYHGARASLTTLGRAAAPLLADLHGGVVVTWAPTTPARRRQRGFDQAEVLAGTVARAVRLRRRRLLRRRPGGHQTGRSAAARTHGPRFEPLAVAPHAVVVVDDVCTTGATLTAAARALRHGGAEWVLGLVLARTPPVWAGRAPAASPGRR